MRTFRPRFTILLICQLVASCFGAATCCGGGDNSCCCSNQLESQPATTESCSCCPAEQEQSEQGECRCQAKTSPWLHDRLTPRDQHSSNALVQTLSVLPDMVRGPVDSWTFAARRHGGSTVQQLFCVWLE